MSKSSNPTIKSFTNGINSVDLKWSDKAGFYGVIDGKIKYPSPDKFWAESQRDAEIWLTVIAAAVGIVKQSTVTDVQEVDEFVTCPGCHGESNTNPDFTCGECGCAGIIPSPNQKENNVELFTEAQAEIIASMTFGTSVTVLDAYNESIKFLGFPIFGGWSHITSYDMDCIFACQLDGEFSFDTGQLLAEELTTMSTLTCPMCKLVPGLYSDPKTTTAAAMTSASRFSATTRKKETTMNTTTIINNTPKEETMNTTITSTLIKFTENAAGRAKCTRCSTRDANVYHLFDDLRACHGAAPKPAAKSNVLIKEFEGGGTGEWFATKKAVFVRIDALKKDSTTFTYKPAKNGNGFWVYIQ